MSSPTAAAPHQPAAPLLARLAVLRKLPLTLSIVAILWIAALATGSLPHGPGEDVLAGVGIDVSEGTGTWWSWFTSGFFATSLLDYAFGTLVVLAAVGVAERMAGPVATAAAYVAGSAASALLLSLLVLLGIASNDEWLQYLGSDYVVGPYGGAAAALGLATARMEPLWRRRVQTWLLAATVMFTLYVGVAQTIQALAGALLGLAAGALAYSAGARRRWRASRYRSTVRESRFLLGTVVGVFALGSLLSQLLGALSVGPMSFSALIMVQASPGTDELKEICNSDAACMSLQSAVGVASAGAAIFSVVPVLLFLLCAEGLRRGRRLAFVAVLGICGYLMLVMVADLLLFLADPATTVDIQLYGLLSLYVGAVFVGPLIIVVLLLWHRAKFTVFSAPESYRRLYRSTGIAAATTVALYCIFWFAEGNLARSSLWTLLGQLAHILIPFPVPFATELPAGLGSTIIYAVGGVVVWLVVLVALWRSLAGLAALEDDGAADRERARILVRRGGGSLSWMALWENNNYWFTPDGRAGLAYQVHNGVALTVADPFGEPDAVPGAAVGFVAHCAQLGVAPCFYSATGALVGPLDGYGFRTLAVAEETLLAIDAMTFKGKEWQNVRTALNRAEKLGIKDLWASYAQLPPGIRAQLAEISAEWVSDKALPEMGFTLGGLEHLKDDAVLCCVAVDDDGLVHGVTSWLPVFDQGTPAGWTLDFMRRRATGFKGVMEFLIASAATHFRATVPTISLSGSPLATAGQAKDDGDHSTLDKVLAQLGDALEPMYGFKSLAAFKSRFQPVHRTLYLYYQDPLALPAIGLAVSNAYLPGLSARQSASLLRRLIGRES
ncbi:bifunctional lysylphosphatidylglycerol flippase/synthetase MprF [Pseudarthrobacter sp. P1]|uniref:bifunctional lysylphosphatidylglycerol flippase/synthetase MprF n=1 Tax=Pseudarthrobacter sp. P1 TaxID=3418418 RepID=UPI003CF5D253